MSNLFRIGNNILDPEEIAEITYGSKTVKFNFRNGDAVEVAWRDATEEAAIQEIISQINVRPGKPAAV